MRNVSYCSTTIHRLLCALQYDEDCTPNMTLSSVGGSLVYSNRKMRGIDLSYFLKTLNRQCLNSPNCDSAINFGSFLRRFYNSDCAHSVSTQFSARLKSLLSPPKRSYLSSLSVSQV